MRTRLITKTVVAALSLALVGASAADAAKSVKYKGKTAQGKAIKFTIKANSLKRLVFTITLNCSEGSTLTDTESGFQATRIKNGKFSADQAGTSDEVVLKGKRRSRGRKGTGTIKVTDKLNSTVSGGPPTGKSRAKRS